MRRRSSGGVSAAVRPLCSAHASVAKRPACCSAHQSHNLLVVMNEEPPRASAPASHVQDAVFRSSAIMTNSHSRDCEWEADAYGFCFALLADDEFTLEDARKALQKLGDSTGSGPAAVAADAASKKKVGAAGHAANLATHPSAESRYAHLKARTEEVGDFRTTCGNKIRSSMSAIADVSPTDGGGGGSGPRFLLTDLSPGSFVTFSRENPFFVAIQAFGDKPHSTSTWLMVAICLVVALLGAALFWAVERVSTELAESRRQATERKLVELIDSAKPSAPGISPEMWLWWLAQLVLIALPRIDDVRETRSGADRVGRITLWLLYATVVVGGTSVWCVRRELLRCEAGRN